MIHCTLRQNKLRVEQDTDVLPFQYSNNINIQFIKDSTYENYVVTPYYAWVPTKSIPPRKLDAFALPLKDGVFTLPMNAFVKDGYLGVAFSLTDGNEVLQTDPVYLAVQSSVGSNNILPGDDSWQLVVIDTVNSYIELNVNDKLQALIKEVAKLDENSTQLQREVNELIDKVNKMLEDGDFIPEHKWENTFLHFKNPDGSWDDGVNLKGPSGVYYGNDTPSEDGEYNVWVLPDGTPDFEIYADQVKTQGGSNVQEEIDNSFRLGSKSNGDNYVQDLNTGMINCLNGDANELVYAGKYFIYGTEQSNTPTVNGWYIDVMVADTNDVFTQVATVSSGYMEFRRTYVNGNFSEWKLISGSAVLYETTLSNQTEGSTITLAYSPKLFSKLRFYIYGSTGTMIATIEGIYDQISTYVAADGIARSHLTTNSKGSVDIFTQVNNNTLSILVARLYVISRSTGAISSGNNGQVYIRKVEGVA